LTLPENLNYIKYNLKNSDEAFELFKITSLKFESSPEIPASIIQKLANRSSIDEKDVDKKLVPRYEYKNMLKAIQKNLEFLDNKQLVDTMFSIGKLHKHHSSQKL
jgi:3-oxoacyl-[acyl-carrier-protein] synthase III